MPAAITTRLVAATAPDHNRAAPPGLAQHLESAHVRHRRIEEDEVDLDGPEHLQRARPVFGLARDHDVRIVREQPVQAGPYDRMVVDEEDADCPSGAHGALVRQRLLVGRVHVHDLRRR
jgi:hypothetical protein